MTERAVQREYSVLATRYDRAWAHYIRESTSLALQELPASPALRILDMGCGTGVLLTRALDADPTRTAIGVDITLNMLRQASRTLPRSVPLLCAGCDAVPVRSRSVDVVVSTSALHYMSDPVGVLREARRVLVPGGTIILSDWCRDYWTMALLDRALRWVDPAHHATLNEETLTRLLSDAGFDTIRLTRSRIDRFWGLMTASANAPVDSAVEESATTLPPPPMPTGAAT